LDILPTRFSDCYELKLPFFKDKRGHLVKIFAETFYQKLKLPTQFKEDFYSVSKKHVLRGLHFQNIPYDQDKVVYCIDGLIFDVVVDLRSESPTFAQHQTFMLSGEQGNGLFIPKGFAHGFYTISDLSIVGYKVSTEHNPSHDSGIHWNSVGIDWPQAKPIVSERDEKLIPFSQFKTPF